MQQWQPDSNGAAMTFDDLYMDRSKGFVNALQELKNLKPQLYSAAEYCEKSYLGNEQKQMVLSNLKDYTIRTMVNAVDHLGTVAYKLNDLIGQQTWEVSSIELNVCRLSQQLGSCKTYCNGEGLRQQQMSPATTRHHKHYILPNSVASSPNNIRGKLQLRSSNSGRSRALFWHFADGESATSRATRSADSKFSEVTMDAFHLQEEEETTAAKPVPNGVPTYDVLIRTFSRKEKAEAAKPMAASKSNQHGKLQVYRRRIRSRSLLSAFFAKNKSFKPRNVPVL